MAKSPLLPPRGERKPGERGSLTPQRPAFSIWYVLGVLLLLAVAQAWFLGTGGHAIPYSEFKSLVRANKVTEVTVGDQSIGGKLQAPRRRPANARTPSSPRGSRTRSWSRISSAPGEVHRRGRQPVAARDPRWIIPLLLLVALWSFFFRRMGGAEGGVMSFAAAARRSTPMTTSR